MTTISSNGCNCRGGIRAPSRAVVAPKIVPAAYRSLCSTLEAEGNNLTVRVGPDGRLFLPSSMDAPAASLLSGSGCRGPFSQSVSAASTKLATVFMSSSAKLRFSSALPNSNVKLGFLLDVLRGF